MLDFVFTQRELFWLDDILPGAKIDEKENKQKNNANLNEKVDSSEDNFFKNDAKNFSRKSSVGLFFIDLLDHRSNLPQVRKLKRLPGKKKHQRSYIRFRKN